MIATESNQETVKKVLTNGCFDLLHRGHVSYLKYIKETEGGELIVLLNSDKSIKSIKGESRPIIDQESRQFMLESLKFVDRVIVFDEPTITNFIKDIKPTVYYKASDYTIESLNKEELEELNKYNTKIKFAPLVDGFSTTTLIKRIHETCS